MKVFIILLLQVLTQFSFKSFALDNEKLKDQLQLCCWNNENIFKPDDPDNINPLIKDHKKFFEKGKCALYNVHLVILRDTTFTNTHLQSNVNYALMDFIAKVYSGIVKKFPLISLRPEVHSLSQNQLSQSLFLIGNYIPNQEAFGQLNNLFIALDTDSKERRQALKRNLNMILAGYKPRNIFLTELAFDVERLKLKTVQLEIPSLDQILLQSCDILLLNFQNKHYKQGIMTVLNTIPNLEVERFTDQCNSLISPESPDYHKSQIIEVLSKMPSSERPAYIDQTQRLMVDYLTGFSRLNILNSLAVIGSESRSHFVDLILNYNINCQDTELIHELSEQDLCEWENTKRQNDSILQNSLENEDTQIMK